MGNTDVQLLPCAFCLPLSRLSKTSVDESQTCISGRCMLCVVVSAESWGIQQHLLGHDRAGMLLTDFAAASPAILIGFMLAVCTSVLHHAL
eukprot:937933-Pyramimonas_sp.AAC.1